MRISGRNFDLEAKCEGTGYPIKGSVKGTLDEDGRINAVLSPGSFRRTDIFGTFPRLQFFSNHSGCQEVLVFKRAEAG